MSQPSSEFDYHPMPVLAPVGLFLGICSAIALLGIFGVVIGVLAMVVSGTALLIIWRSAGALTGKKLAGAGLVLSTVFTSVGAGMQWYAFTHEVPDGFARVSFSQDIAAKDFVVEEGVQTVHPEVRNLDGKPVFLKGFMYPTSQTEGLTTFLLVKDSGQCCFGGQPALTDMIGVKMTTPDGVNFYDGRVSVAGKFRLNPNYTGASALEPIYLLEGEFFSKSKTIF